MSVIVYACALVGINFFAILSDRMNRRGLALLGACCTAIVGVIMLLTITDHKGRLAGTCILAFGSFATIPVTSVWLTVNIAGYTKRGSASAMMNMIAQAFTIIGNQAFVDPPYCKSESGARLSKGKQYIWLLTNSFKQIVLAWRHHWDCWLYMWWLF